MPVLRQVYQLEKPAHLRAFSNLVPENIRSIGSALLMRAIPFNLHRIGLEGGSKYRCSFSVEGFYSIGRRPSSYLFLADGKSCPLVLECLQDQWIKTYAVDMHISHRKLFSEIFIFFYHHVFFMNRLPKSSFITAR